MENSVGFFCTSENTSYAASVNGVNLIPASYEIFIDVTSLRQPIR